MISKELLSEVLNKKIQYIVTDIKQIHHNIRSDVKTTEIAIYYENKWNIINIYELAHKCKEWAFAKGYSIIDGIDTVGDKICYIMKITGYSVDYYYEQTDDFKDVFKSCQWILDNQK